MLITRADDKMRRFDFKDYVFTFILLIDNSARGWIKFSRIDDTSQFRDLFFNQYRTNEPCLWSTFIKPHFAVD